MTTRSKDAVTRTGGSGEDRADGDPHQPEFARVVSDESNKDTD